MPCRAIFLMGAPTLQSLRWDEAELLNGPIYPFNNSQENDTRKQSTFSNSPSVPITKWRLLQAGSFDNNIAKNNDGDTLFLTSDDLVVRSDRLMNPTNHDELENDGSDLLQFYNHSFAIHESFSMSRSDRVSGGISGETQSWEESTGGASVEESTSGEGDTLSLSFSAASSSSPKRPNLTIRGPISDIGTIPNVKYLTSIVPQTMTVNLVVSVLAIHPPRRVVTKQWKRELDIVELVVGDETSTGFRVTFWLSSIDGGGNLGRTLFTLRPQDIVLLRTIALSSFGDRVYGQSLCKGTTQVDLLHRQPVDLMESCGLYSLRAVSKVNNVNNVMAEGNDPLLVKVQKVREWIMRFVGYAHVGGSGGGIKHRHVDNHILPPDTQES